MPRRSSVRNQSLQQSPGPPQHIAPSPSPALPEALATLRTQWKWAAFSQFFFTFNHLFSINQISLNDIEHDLVHGSSIVLPRVMQRLLYTLTYDRKISLDNWQTALRKQYRKRDPAANPIGPEPRVLSPEPRFSPPVSNPDDPPAVDDVAGPDTSENSGGNRTSPSTQPESQTDGNADPDTDAEMHLPESTRASTLELDRGPSLGASVNGLSVQPSESDSFQILSGQLGDHPDEQDRSKDWLDLPMLAKLDSIHLVAEWQFQNPMRLRTLMRSDNDDATWRIEPIGYDSKKHAYWLIGADRLWIQRTIPKPRPPPSKHKPKLNGTLNSKSKAKASISPSQSLKRKRGAGLPPSSSKSKRPRLHDSSSNIGASSGGSGRAAKAHAKVKLDAQAKELAEFNRQTATSARSQSGLRSSQRGKVASSLTTGNGATGLRKGKEKDWAIGTRISARLRGSARDDNEEWQAVPQEWLAGEDRAKMSNGGGRKEEEDWLHDVAVKTGLEREGSEISDLTELSEDNESVMENGDGRGKGQEYEAINQEDEDEEGHLVQDIKQEETQGMNPRDDRGAEEPTVLPEGFIEWETICITLYEWEHIAERFARATHYLEKDLYKVLANEIVPTVTEELREIERKQQLSLAITQRKRSSRLLLRQSEREEAEASARKVAEEEERNSRARRAEARQRKEEADRERRETARELRRREREEKERAASVETDNKTNGSSVKPSVTHMLFMEADGTVPRSLDLTPTLQNGGLRNNSNGNSTLTAGSGSRTPVGDDWELDCEICYRHGINLDDGIPMMSCGLCSKWQHIACHDRTDQEAGRRPRNWDVVEFFCLRCRAHRAGTAFPNTGDSSGGSGAGVAPPVEDVHLAVGADDGQLNQAQYFGNAYLGAGRTSYIAAVGSQTASRPPAVNGSNSPNARKQLTSTAHSASSTHTRGVQPRHHQQSQSSHPQQQPYGTHATFAFSHYQPQHRGFSSSPLQQQHYNASGHTQPYGHHAISGASSQFVPLSNGGQSYQQTPQTRWNITAPIPHGPSFNATPYAGVPLMTNNVGHYGHDQRSTMASSHTPVVAGQNQQWHHSTGLSPLAEAQNVNLQQQQIQHTSHFQYHSTSYQPQTS